MYSREFLWCYNTIYIMGANFGHIIIYYTTFPTSPEYGLTPPWEVEHHLGMSMDGAWGHVWSRHTLSKPGPIKYGG